MDNWLGSVSAVCFDGGMLTDNQCLCTQKEKGKGEKKIQSTRRYRTGLKYRDGL